MTRPALPEERGAGLRRDRADPVPEGLRHVVERIDDHDRPPFDKCSECGESGSIGSVNPFGSCPARSLPLGDRSSRRDGYRGQGSGLAHGRAHRH